MSFYNYIFTQLGTHLLEAIENELKYAEPEISKIIIREIELLVAKLEIIINKKNEIKSIPLQGNNQYKGN